MAELSLNFRNRVTVLGLDDDSSDRTPTVAELDAWKEALARKAEKFGLALVGVESGETSSVRVATFQTAAANPEALRSELVTALDEVPFTLRGQSKKEMRHSYFLGLPALTTIGALRNS